MDTSPLAKLPPELRHLIYEYALTEAGESLGTALARYDRPGGVAHTDCERGNCSHLPEHRFLPWLSNRRPLLATCHEIQSDAASIFLCSNGLLVPSPGYIYESPGLAWCRDVFTELNEALMRSIRRIGFSLIETVLFQKYTANWAWDINPTGVIHKLEAIFRDVDKLKRRTIRHNPRIREDAFLVQMRYPVPQYMCDDYPGIIKQGSEKARTRNFVNIDICLRNEERSRAQLAKIYALLVREQKQKTKKTEMLKKETATASIESIVESSNSDHILFLQQRREDFDLWLRRLHLYHSASITVACYAWNILYKHGYEKCDTDVIYAFKQSSKTDSAEERIESVMREFSRFRDAVPNE